MKEINLKNLFDTQGHIGHLKQYRHPSIKPFLFTTYNTIDIIDLKHSLEQIKTAKHFLNQFLKNELAVISKLIDFQDVLCIKKWKAGILTNPLSLHHITPKVLIIDSVSRNSIAVKEAKRKNICIVGFCDTNTSLKNIDYPIIINDDSFNNNRLILNYLLTN
jgi:ribosomal protein S2